MAVSVGNIVMLLKVGRRCVGRWGWGVCRVGGMTLQQWQLAAQLAGAIS